MSDTMKPGGAAPSKLTTPSPKLAPHTLVAATPITAEPASQAEGPQAESPHRGRPIDTRLAEDLAALCILSRPEATATREGISNLLGLNAQRTKEVFETLSSGLGSNAEEASPALALYTIDEDTFANAAPATQPTPPALRLTTQQAQACSRALDRLGIERGDELRTQLEEAFFPTNYEKQPAQEPEDDPGATPVLLACARSIASARIDPLEPSLITQRIVTFSYQGENDLIERSRRIAPRRLRLANGHWLVDAHDLDAMATRTFFACRMSHPRTTDELARIPRAAEEAPDSGSVNISCTPRAASHVRSWPQARELSRSAETVTFEVPYYRGDWLPRHLLALGGEVSFDNPGLAREMRDIAKADLRAMRRLQARKAQGVTPPAGSDCPR